MTHKIILQDGAELKQWVFICISVSNCSSVCWDTSCTPCQSAPDGPVTGSGETKCTQFPPKVLSAQHHLVITCQLKSGRHYLGQKPNDVCIMYFYLKSGHIHALLDVMHSILMATWRIPESIWQKFLSKHKCASWSLLHDHSYFNQELFGEPNPKRGDQP